MRTNKVYSVVTGGSVAAAGGLLLQNWILESTCSKISLKSVYWDVQLYQSVLGIPLNEFNQQTQRSMLEIGLNVWPISSIFTPGVPAPNIVQNGDTICLHRQGQLIFDAFSIQNRTNIRYNGVNLDALLAIDHICTIVIETEEEL